MSRARPGRDERKTVEDFMHATAGVTWSKAAFANAFVYEHPTFQQYAMETILEVISALADEYVSGRYDARNAEAARAAYVMRNALIDEAEAEGKEWNSSLPHI